MAETALTIFIQDYLCKGSNVKNAIATDKAPMRGVFSLRVKDREGNIVEEYEDHNMIVNGAKMVMAKLISDPSKAANLVVRNIAFGTGLASAAADDTSLGNLQTLKNIDSYEYPADTADRVQFNWSLGYDECNEKDITEFGLVCADSETLFAKKTRRAIYKDDTLSFEGTWTIIF